MKVNEVTVLPLVEYPKSRDLLHALSEQIETPSPGDAFAGWEYCVPLVRPRSHSLFTLIEKPLVVFDEPEQISSAAERLWKRLEDPDRPSPSRRRRISSTGTNCARIEDQGRSGDAGTRSGARSRRHAYHTRPSMTFHGNMQVAVAEARNLVEQGNRVGLLRAIDRRTGTYGRYFSGILVFHSRSASSRRTTRRISRRAIVHGWGRGQHVPGQRKMRRGAHFRDHLASSDPRICSIPPILWRGPDRPNPNSAHSQPIWRISSRAISWST